MRISLLPQAETIDFTALSPKQLVKKNISTTVNLLFFFALVYAGRFFLPEAYLDYFSWVLGILILMGFWSYIRNFQWQKRSGYALRERDIVYKRGFLSEKTTVVPFNRVQHVSTSRGVLDKMLGLSTLLVFTAGGSGSDISIPGLTPELAASLKEAISGSMSGYV